MRPTSACAVVLLCTIVRTQQLVNFTDVTNTTTESVQTAGSVSSIKHETSYSEEKKENNSLSNTAPVLNDTHKTKSDLWDRLVYYLKNVSHVNDTVNDSGAEIDGRNGTSDNWSVFPIQSDQGYSETDDISLSSLEGLTDDEVWQRLIRKPGEEDYYRDSYHDYESVPEDGHLKAETESTKGVKKISDERLIKVSEDSITRKRHITRDSCVDGNCLAASSANNVSAEEEIKRGPVREIKLTDVDKFLSSEFQNDHAAVGPKDAKGSSSLAIVFDTTGSMWDDLVQVRQGIKSIIATMLERPDKPIQDYVLVPFHDPSKYQLNVMYLLTLWFSFI